MKEEKGKARVSTRRRKMALQWSGWNALKAGLGFKSQGMIEERQKLKHHVLATKSVMT